MLSKKERLSREEFNRFFLLGKRHHSKNIQLVYHPYKTLHASVVVSKKIQKSAAKRNKIRRRVYNTVRNNKKEGVFIFILKKGVATLPSSELRDEVVGIINEVTTNKQ